MVNPNPNAVVLMGIEMSGMNGLAVREGFLADPEAPSTEAQASLDIFSVESFVAENSIDRHGWIERF